MRHYIIIIIMIIIVLRAIGTHHINSLVHTHRVIIGRTSYHNGDIVLKDLQVLCSSRL